MPARYWIGIVAATMALAAVLWGCRGATGTPTAVTPAATGQVETSKTIVTVAPGITTPASPTATVATSTPPALPTPLATSSQPATLTSRPVGTTPASATAGDPSKGEKTFSAIGCVGCHTVKGVGGQVGPDLSDIGRRQDVEYIRRSIAEPGAAIVVGYQPVMPSPAQFGLSEQDIADLVAYLAGLK
ncbi:MAG: c-type cytochrome [Chloroflexi bacterium]|nr:c-type cytochrome [Chloroflexota bacterium]